MDIEPLDPRAAADAEIAALHDLVAGVERELVPSLPPMTREQLTGEMRAGPAWNRMRCAVVWDGPEHDRALAAGLLYLDDRPGNTDSAYIDVSVRSEVRRQGLGRAILARLLDAAEDDGRRSVLAEPWIDSPGPAFLVACGLEDRLPGWRRALDVAGVDGDLLDDWIERVEERAAGYDLVVWEGPAGDRLAALAEATAIMNTAPFGDLEDIDDSFSVDDLAEAEASRVRRGIEWWTSAAIAPDGTIAGFSQLYFNPGHTELAEQGDTGVHPDHRNLGLGRWLKAVILRKLLAERPQMTIVATWNAGSNAPMNAINDQLGFRSVAASGDFQAPIKAVRDRLAASRSVL
jgi:GNAT superfamily N-acetyltransferase